MVGWTQTKFPSPSKWPTSIYNARPWRCFCVLSRCPQQRHRKYAASNKQSATFRAGSRVSDCMKFLFLFSFRFDLPAYLLEHILKFVLSKLIFDDVAGIHSWKPLTSGLVGDVFFPLRKLI